MNRIAIALASAGALAVLAAPMPAAANEALAKKHNCMACHQVDKKVVGPAFREVAERYRGKPEAVGQLAERLKTGGSGNWGGVPMPPNPDLAESDARALVKWILGQAV